MYILAKLIFQSYIPKEIKKGMLFKQRISEVIYGNVYEYDRIYQIQMDQMDYDGYTAANGMPVKPVIVSITANPDDNADILATDDQIGWWDEGPQSDELRDIELKDINLVLQEDDGMLEIEVKFHITDDGEELIEPVLYMDKVTIRSVSDEDLEDEEDWDDMDDLTDYDNPEWPHDHPKDKTDHDPED